MTDTHLLTFALALLLLTAAAIDIATMRIPDALNALIVLGGLSASMWLQKPLLAAVGGAALGYATLFLLNNFYRRARGRDGLGMGDAKLLAGAGAWVGWAGLPFVVLIASTAGLAYVALVRVAGRTLHSGDALAFGPFLCLGIMIVWVTQTFV